MLGMSSVAAQLAAPQEGLSSITLARVLNRVECEYSQGRGM
jgi:hypothetical protein